MWSVVKAKLALLLQTKVGATVLATVLVAGGGSAAAMAATHGNLGQIGSGIVSAVSGHGSSNDNNADHMSLEGTVTNFAAPTTSGNGSLTVKPDKGDAVDFVVTSDTRVNGYHGGQPSGAQQSGAQHSEGTPGANAHTEGTPDASHPSSDSHPSGDSQAASFSDLASAQTNGYRVQVQANKDSKGNWVAWKVTIEGPGSDQAGQSGDNQSTDQNEQETPGTSGDSSHSGDSGGSHSGDSGGSHEPTPSASPEATSTGHGG